MVEGGCVGIHTFSVASVGIYTSFNVPTGCVGVYIFNAHTGCRNTAEMRGPTFGEPECPWCWDSVLTLLEAVNRSVGDGWLTEHCFVSSRISHRNVCVSIVSCQALSLNW